MPFPWDNMKKSKGLCSWKQTPFCVLTRYCQSLRIFEPIDQFQTNGILVPKAQKYYSLNFMGNGGPTGEKNPNQHPSGGKSGLFGSVVDLHGSPLAKTSVGSSVNW